MVQPTLIVDLAKARAVSQGLSRCRQGPARELRHARRTALAKSAPLAPFTLSNGSGHHLRATEGNRGDD
jgi:hypothetical protein